MLPIILTNGWYIAGCLEEPKTDTAITCGHLQPRGRDYNQATDCREYILLLGNWVVVNLWTERLPSKL
jgi:hypothetical protein